MIRDATPADVPALVEFGRQMHADSGYATFDYDEEKVARLINALIEVQNGIALVADVVGEPAGGFIGAVQPHFFGNDMQAFDYALFLSPRHRSSAIAPQLIAAYVDAAKARNAKQIVIGNSTGHRSEKVLALFESMGFRRVGYNCEWVL